METQKVNELNVIQNVELTDSIPLLTDEIDNVVDRLTVASLLANSVSNQTNNAIQLGNDSKLFVNNPQSDINNRANIDLSNLSQAGIDKIAEYGAGEEILKVQNAYLTGELSNDSKIVEQVKDMKRSTFDRSKFTVVGTPTITDDGVVSNFSDNNFLATSTDNNYIDLNKFNSWKIGVKFKKTASTIAYQYIVDFSRDGGANVGIYVDNNTNSVACIVYDNSFNLIVSRATGSYQIQNNVWYYITFEFTGNNYIGKISEDNSNWTTFVNVAQSTKCCTTNTNVLIGRQRLVPSRQLEGSIDVKEFYTIGDGIEVFNGNKTGIDQITETLEIPYTQSKTGSKIVDAVYRDRVQDVYEQFGQANYYTLLDGEKYNVTKVGSPTLVGGIASGFSGSSYFTLPDLSILGTANNWEINCKFTTGTVITPTYSQHVFVINENEYYKGVQIQLTMDSKLRALISAVDGTEIIGENNAINLTATANTTYWWKISFNGSTYTSKYSLDGTNYTTLQSVNSNKKITTNLNTRKIGQRASGVEQFLGSIDLSQFSIEVEGKEVFRGYEKYNVTLPMGEVYGMIEEKEDRWVYFQDGASGYKYNTRNGYCEQWGSGVIVNTGSSTLVNLLKTYRDTSYSAFSTSNGDYYGQGQANNSAIKTSTSSITLTNGSHLNCPFSWETKGYLASGQY